MCGGESESEHALHATATATAAATGRRTETSSALVESGGAMRAGEACGVARGRTRLLSSDISSFSDRAST